jgi:hypothetical protein
MNPVILLTILSAVAYANSVDIHCYKRVGDSSLEGDHCSNDRHHDRHQKERLVADINPDLLACQTFTFLNYYDGQVYHLCALNGTAYGETSYSTTDTAATASAAVTIPNPLVVTTGNPFVDLNNYAVARALREQSLYELFFFNTVANVTTVKTGRYLGRFEYDISINSVDIYAQTISYFTGFNRVDTHLSRMSSDLTNVLTAIQLVNEGAGYACMDFATLPTDGPQAYLCNNYRHQCDFGQIYAALITCPTNFKPYISKDKSTVYCFNSSQVHHIRRHHYSDVDPLQHQQRDMCPYTRPFEERHADGLWEVKLPRFNNNDRHEVKYMEQDRWLVRDADVVQIRDGEYYARDADEHRDKKEIHRRHHDDHHHHRHDEHRHHDDHHHDESDSE